MNSANAIVKTARRDAFAILMPPPDLSGSEWADRYRRLSPEASAEPGQWRTDRAPYQRGILDACTDPTITEVVIMSSAQIGKSEMLLSTIGYYVHQDPAPIMLLQPTVEMAQSFSKDRIAPMVRDTPALLEKIDQKARDAASTILHKKFAGGHLTITGANSPSSLASRPIRTLLCDEVDRYPVSAGSEGDPVNLARKRTATFWNRKIILTSTPTIKGLSRIEFAYEASDKRRYHVPCPDCGEFQVLKWANVKWDEGKPQEARYVCEHCGVFIEDRQKHAMLAKGEWRAEGVFEGVAGFHLNELYSPWRTFGDVAVDFLNAKHAGSEMLKTWVNTSLGEVWEDQGDAVEPTGLMARVEDYERDDLDLLAVTAGVDVQKDRLECTVVGWGQKEEAWLIEHAVIPGDTAQAAVWQELHELLTDHAPSAVAIDSGFNSSMVYAFCEKRRFCFATKGVSGFDKPFIEDAARRARRLRNRRKIGGSPVQLIGVDGGKVLVHSRLRIVAPGPGYIHFPNAPDFDTEYFEQLGAEKLITRHRMGRQVQEWQQVRPRNEALDCLVYATAALRLWGALDQVAVRKARLAERPATEDKPERPAKPQRKAGGGFINSWKSGGLRRPGGW